MYLFVFLLINFAVVTTVDPVEKDFELPWYKEVLFYSACEFMFAWDFITGVLNSKIIQARAIVEAENQQTDSNSKTE